MRTEAAPILSARTLERMTQLQFRAGEVSVVNVAHEEFCYRALQRGAKRCVCEPDLNLVPVGGG
jgi:hypothetical protein